ncbi:hypothetical protein KR026_012654, partial [Drosophila bipectinata]
MFKRSCTLLEGIPKIQVAQWLAKIDTFIFGTNGILWNGNEPVENAIDTFNMLKMKGKQVLIVTNDSMLQSSELVTKAKNMGFLVEKNEVLTAAGLVTNFLKDQGIEGKVLVCGSKCLELEIMNAGFCTDVDNLIPEGKTAFEQAQNTIIDKKVSVVLIGQDCDMDSKKMIVACNYLLNTNVLLVATSMDKFVTAGKYRIPDAGCLVEAIKSVIHRNPIILGKPNPQILGDLASKIKPDKTLVIGNSLKSDILFANLCNFQSLLIGCENGKLDKIYKIVKEKNKFKMGLVPDTFLSRLSLFMNFLCA